MTSKDPNSSKERVDSQGLISLTDVTDSLYLKHEQSWETQAFADLVEHFELFAPKQLAKLGALYGAPKPTAWHLAAVLCLHPERLTQRLRALSPKAQHGLMQVVMEHDFEVTLDFIKPKTHRELAILGLLPPRPTFSPGTCIFPGVLAMMCGLQVESLRVTLPLMCGMSPAGQVMEMGACFGIQAATAPLVLMQLIEVSLQEGAQERLMDAVGDPNYLSWALMVLELGGLCFWEEIFGPESMPGFREPGVLRLMSEPDRAFESSAIETLLYTGILVQRDAPDLQGRVMLAIPEELIPGLWALGQQWRSQMVQEAFESIQMTAQHREAVSWSKESMHGCLKWLVCEALGKEGLHLPLRPDELARLVKASGLDQPEISLSLEWGKELGVFLESATKKVVCDVPLATEALDGSRQAFGQATVYRWCTGEVGAHVDVSLTQAIGLDETWRQEILGMHWHRQSDRLPSWLLQEGLESKMTGAGYLRVLEDSPPGLLLGELSLVNSYIWSTKLLWLDLLSCLDGESWQTIGALEELLLQCAMLSLFEHFAHLLDGPEPPQYLPVQRVTLLCEPVHLEHFERWCHEIIHRLFVPLGIAQCDGHLVRLRPEGLRIQNPPGMTREHRAERVTELLGDHASAFKMPGAPGPNLRAVEGGETSEASGQVRLDDVSMAYVIDRARSEHVRRYGAGNLEFSKDRESFLGEPG